MVGYNKFLYEGKKLKARKIIAISITLIIIIFSLIYEGYLWPNNFFARNYPIHGIDVSNHQKEIEWNKVANDDKAIQFVYIKATEGEDFKDPFFKDNWIKSGEVGLLRGAYHFYTFNSSGENQAKNFIESVPVENDTLPPVIDLEFAGNSKNIPSREELVKELKIFISILEDKYKQKPILYLTHDSYETFIKGEFLDYHIWIRDIVKKPKLDNQRNWVFWQYSNRGKVDGINGFVDLNVFIGEADELKALTKK